MTRKALKRLIFFLAIIFLGDVAGWAEQAPANHAAPIGSEHFSTNSVTNFSPYLLKTSGGIIKITNAPDSNPVHIFFTRFDTHPRLGEVAVFRITNSDTRTILVWNVRVQTRSSATTNAPAWETIHDDYPSVGQTVHLNAGAADDFLVPRPESDPWRLCILYSRGTTDSDRPKTYDGSYEIISKVMQ